MYVGLLSQGQQCSVQDNDRPQIGRVNGQEIVAQHLLLLHRVVLQLDTGGGEFGTATRTSQCEVCDDRSL